MNLQNLESISVIAASWIGIVVTIYNLFDSKKKGHRVDKNITTVYHKSDWFNLFKKIWIYFILIALFVYAIYNKISTSDVVTKLDVLLISGCVGVIILLIIRIMYVYTIWKAIRSLDDGIAY